MDASARAASFRRGVISWPGAARTTFSGKERGAGAGHWAGHIGDPAALLVCLQVSFFLFVVFVVYTMLPFSMRDAVIASMLTSSSHTIVLSVCLSATPGAKEHLVWQVGDSTSLWGARGATHLLGVRLRVPGRCPSSALGP